MRLIPKDIALGWTPYAWLVYLVFFWFGPIFSPNTTPTTMGGRGQSSSFMK